ncbi:MAG: peptide-methionine (S)-S-oxide reductase MsrA [Traorella sp.]
MKEIYLAGGCFWGIQKYFDQFDGVVMSIVGYANGKTAYPTYQEVKSQRSGHVECVHIYYDENIISLKEIIEKFYNVIDPTSLNKQGEDEGISYRTGIYYVDSNDIEEIFEVKNKLERQYEKKSYVEVGPLMKFYPAEEYHQKYLEKNPDGYCHIDACYFKN